MTETISAPADAWQGPDSPVGAEVAAQARANLESYRVNPPLLEEQTNIELAAAEGGYGRRQLYELVQNGADALLDRDGGRIEVVLTDEAFYCANEGGPIDVPGVRAILLSNVSQKRGDQIGRFGLGFKSVLEVTDSPEFYSRSGSFAWDFNRAVAAVADVVSGFNPVHDPVPKLRLAWPVDPQAAFAADDVLAELAEWATTVVKLPFASTNIDWLAEDVATFPAPFLLFCRHVRRLVLDNRSAIVVETDSGTESVRRREVSLEPLEQPRGCLRLTEDENSSVWKVFSTIHEPGPEALHDAGTMSKREQIPIHWAMPLAGRVGPGVLWAFFPTEYETTLSGIVNAPWKTNPDRKNLLEGAFNREVLDVVAELVINSLRKLHSKKDPGRLLDLIPARGDEARNWADRQLTERYYALAADAPSLPDQTGSLRRPGELSLHPRLKGTGEEARAAIQELLGIWADAAPSADWCHPTVERRERRPRVERLIKDGGGTLVSWAEWLEALVERPSALGSKAAVQLAARLTSEGFAPDFAVAGARIVLTEDGRVVAASHADLYFQGDYEGPADADYVHPDLARDPGARRALEQLGVAAVDATADLEALLKQHFAGWINEEWESFWDIVRRVGAERAAGIIKARRKWPFVRVREGHFRPLHSALLPGSIASADGNRDRDVAVDMSFHSPDIDLLRELGLREAPEAAGGELDEPWFDEYKTDALVRYRHLLTGSRRPRENLLGFFENRPFAGPLGPLDFLSDQGRMLMTEAALAAETDYAPWVFCHTRNPDVYPKLEMPPPVVWRLLDEGRFGTSLGPRPASACVGPALADWADVLPVAECSAVTADAFGFSSDLDDVSAALWLGACGALASVTDDERIGLVYLAACNRIDAPQSIFCRIGESHGLESLSKVTVVWTQAQLEALAAQSVPTVLVPSSADADKLRAHWKMGEGAKVETNVAYGVAAEETLLVDRFPSLEWQLDDERHELVLVPCNELRLETITAAGRTADEVDLHVANGKVFYDEGLDDETLLARLAPELGVEIDVEDAVAKGRDAERRRRIADVRAKATVAERLLAAVDAPRLRARLPKGLLAALEVDGRTLAPEELAELALSVYGVDVLRVYHSDVQAAGLDPPKGWRGSSQALTFVRRLGFPREFAGFEHPRRSPLLEVEGPPEVPDLHDFQRAIVDEFRRLIRGELDGKRAILSLPTGAGKTRVAVEALIEAIRSGEVNGPILWVAQSDELCEQAVQTWSFVWRGIGPPHEMLAVSRLWSGNDAQPVDANAQVVVATIQKLPGCIKDPDYAWLAEAGCVVIDEAHHSTTPSYSRLLRWLGLQGRRQTRPLVGLTATPYRGVSEAETKRLVDRYGARRLDSVAFGERNPYPILQRSGILANVEHRLIEGADIELDASGLAHVRKMRVLPPSAEGALGRRVERNRRLLDEVKRLPDDWTILFFATSVDHAQTMAALLTLEGIEAKPITGLTEDGPRRHYIEEFREQRVRVLTNYNVLTQGFDAPAVRAVIVARPTYSPNLYQQMIGRGLRGPLNGGKETCLIVNVQDNVVSYGEDLAFRDFEYLWDGTEGLS
jgi:superfamily II DNA or RNA helicase